MSWKPANAELEEGPWRSTVGRDLVSRLTWPPEMRLEAEDLAKLQEEVDRAASSEVPKLEAPFTELDLSIMEGKHRLFLENLWKGLPRTPKEDRTCCEEIDIFERIDEFGTWYDEDGQKRQRPLHPDKGPHREYLSDDMWAKFVQWQWDKTEAYTISTLFSTSSGSGTPPPPSEDSESAADSESSSDEMPDEMQAQAKRCTPPWRLESSAAPPPKRARRGLGIDDPQLNLLLKLV